MEIQDVTHVMHYKLKAPSQKLFGQFLLGTGFKHLLHLRLSRDWADSLLTMKGLRWRHSFQWHVLVSVLPTIICHHSKYAGSVAHIPTS